MTARNRHRNSEKSAASSQDDAPKKSQATNSASAAPAPGPQRSRPRSRSFVGALRTTLFYVAVISAAGFAAFYLQKVVSEMQKATARQEESARKNADMATKLDGVVLQMNGLKSAIDELEASAGISRAELEGAMSRMKSNELETRRVEETLQKLQDDLLRDLSEGMNEVKEAREKDFSSLEKTVEERLAEASHSIKVSLEEFTKAQGEAQSQLAELRARLGGMEDPALIKQELSAIVDVVAEIKTSKQTSHSSVESLGEQIGAVRAELQIRNQEVASLSQEVETMRSVMQENIGSLRKVVSAAEANVQALKDTSGALESSVGQATDAVHHVETQMNEAETRARKQADDLEARVKASEESADSLSASMSDITSKVESLLSKRDEAESAVAANAAEEAKRGVQQEVEALEKRLGELQSSVYTLGDNQASLTAKDSDLDQLVRDLEVRLATVEGGGGGSSSGEPEQLRSLRSTLASLEAKAAKLEQHEEAIASLQKALEETTRTLAETPNAKEKEE